MFNLETISPKMLDYYVGSSKAIIIDLRTKEEFCESHIRGAINVPYEGGRLNYCLPKEKGIEIILYCARGSLSLMAGRELAKKNYRVRSVIGGLHAYKGKNLVDRASS